jgi:sirohydrochlorin cobaltochelatase
MFSAYLLVSHGSSDPRHQAGLARLARGVQHRLLRSPREAALSTVTALAESGGSPRLRSQGPMTYWGATDITRPSGAQSLMGKAEGPLVGTATLEASETPLSEQIVTFAQSALAQGVRHVVIVPLFLLAGVHVKDDLPAEIAHARTQISARLRLTCLPYLGGQARFQQLVARRLAKTQAERCVLLAHGSRRPTGNQGIQQIGTALNAEVAFWTVPPDLETQIYALMQRGYQHLAIAPYFLFPGGITDAITRRTEELAERLPKLSLRLLAPVGTSTDLGDAIADWLLNLPRGVTQSALSQVAMPIAENGITA